MGLKLTCSRTRRCIHSVKKGYWPYGEGVHLFGCFMLLCFYLVQCNCGKCTDGNLSCNGKKYKTRYKLKCLYHILAYKIELHNRSKQAERVISTELGRGHTNQLESANSALIRLRKKSWVSTGLDAVYDDDLTVVGAGWSVISLKTKCSMQWSNPCTHELIL